MQARSIVVPTDDAQVKARLREFGEPICEWQQVLLSLQRHPLSKMVETLQGGHCIVCWCVGQRSELSHKLLTSYNQCACAGWHSVRVWLCELFATACVPLWCVKGDYVSVRLIGLFGEGPADRRDRLRRILAELSKCGHLVSVLGGGWMVS